MSLPPPSPPYPFGLSQKTGFGCPASCIKLALVICFTRGNVYASMLFSQIIPPSPSPTESQSLFLLDWDSVKSWITCEHGPDAGLGSEPGVCTSSPSAYSPTVGPVYSLSLKTLSLSQSEPKVNLNLQWPNKLWGTWFWMKSGSPGHGQRRWEGQMKTEREITTAAGGEKWQGGSGSTSCFFSSNGRDLRAKHLLSASPSVSLHLVHFFLPPSLFKALRGEYSFSVRCKRNYFSLLLGKMRGGWNLSGFILLY